MFGSDGAALDEMALALAGEAAVLPCDVPGASWPELGELSPGPQTAERLARLPVAELDEYDLVEAVAGWERLAAFAHAGQVAAIAELVRRPLFAGLSSLRDGIDASGAVALEVSARLRVSVAEADRRVGLAELLADKHAATLSALADGVIDYWRARTIVDGLLTVTDRQVVRDVEARVLAIAPQVSRSTLRAKVAKAVAAADPQGAARRHERAVADRRVCCRPELDGMGWTWALLSAHDTWVLDRVLDAAADGLARDCPGDGRTRDQRRADALAAMAHTAWRSGWIGGCPRCGVADPAVASPDPTVASADLAEERRGTGAPARLSGHGRRMEIGVLVPYSTLIGLDEQPAELIGYGPIPAEVARRIAAEGIWRRILTDPATGAVLDYGTTRYVPPADLAAHVMLRDQTCRGVGCTRPAAACDLDHTVPAPAGPTSATNLCPLCRRHHNGKTCAGWRLAQPEPGHLVWRSPTGHTYDRPAEPVGPIIDPPTGNHDPPPF